MKREAHKKVLTILHCGNSSASVPTMPTAQNNVPRCCLQRRSFFCVLGNNAEKCSIISSCVFFRVVDIYADFFPRCRPQHRKIICVVVHNMEKWPALLATKTFEFDYLVRIQNHMQIYPWISIRGLG
jgi:hypothetical protein